ncbi:MAG: hypothetical protein WC055_12010 [Melioribacteraceae bacterium]
MFKLFTTSKKQYETIKRDVSLMTKSNNQIIEEIHDSFYSEVDLLLAEAKISKSTETTKQSLIEKAERLTKLGFSQTKECIEANAEIKRISDLQAENNSKSELIAAINHFSFKYPNYKFITEDSVKKICAKYNLIYSEISRYTGTVPDKNLKHIEDFKINERDECWQRLTESRWSSETSYFSGNVVVNKREKEEKEKIMRKEYLESLSEEQKHDYLFREMQLEIPSFNLSSMYSHRITEGVAPLEIVAPLSDFNTDGMELKDFTLSKIEIPDPIVLKPVFHGNKKHYLIVTAWGLEASDELVVNQKFN